MKFIKYYLILILAAAAFSGCDLIQEDTPESVSQVEVSINNLNQLPSGYQYFAWLKLSGATNQKLGAITPDSNGNVSKVFDTKNLIMHTSQSILITIEPVVDDTSLKAPSSVVVLSGAFRANEVQLNLDNFNNMTGGFILDTPTDSTANFNETSGIWFVLPDTGNSLKQGLKVPAVSGNWEYVAFLEQGVDTLEFSTFKSPIGVDAFKNFSGTKNRYAYPGEDFLLNAPTGFVFPLDLNNLKVTVGIRNTLLPNKELIKLFETTVTEPANGKIFTMNGLLNQVPSGTVKFLLQI